LKKPLYAVLILSVFIAGGNLSAQDAPENNAALVYQKAANLLREMPKDSQGFIKNANVVIENGWTSEFNDLKPLILKNTQAIAEFRSGAKVEKCDFTLGEKFERTPAGKTPNFAGVVNLARLALLQARLFEQQNKWDAVLDDYLAVLRLECHLNRQKDHVLLSQMIGLIVQKMAYKPLCDLIKRKELTFKQASLLSAEMNAARRGSLGLDAALVDEREFARAAGESLMSFDEKGDYKREFMKEFNAREDEIFALLNGAYARNDLSAFNKAIKGFDELLQKEIKEKQRFNPLIPKDIAASMQDPQSALRVMPFYGPKIMARYLAGIGASQYARVIASHYIARVNFDLLRIAAAIRSYKLKNRRLPDSLLAMTPDYLDVVPADPFNYFRPVKYVKSKKEWRVYSLGPDRNDDQAKVVHSGATEKIEEKGDLVITGG